MHEERTQLTKALFARDPDRLGALLTAGADPNALYGNGSGGERTLLHQAVVVGSSECMALLLNHGADPNGKDEWGHTPLHLVARGEQTETMNRLLQHGADPNAQDHAGNTPLHHAVEARSKNAASILAEAGARTDIKNERGETPASMASDNLPMAEAIRAAEHRRALNVAVPWSPSQEDGKRLTAALCQGESESQARPVPQATRRRM